MINSEQIGGVIRALMTLFGGWAMEHGFSQDEWLAVSGGVIAVVGVLWSLYSNSTPNLVKNVAKSSNVHKVVVSPELLWKADSPKVVSK